MPTQQVKLYTPREASGVLFVSVGRFGDFPSCFGIFTGLYLCLLPSFSSKTSLKTDFLGILGQS